VFFCAALHSSVVIKYCFFYYVPLFFLNFCKGLFLNELEALVILTSLPHLGSIKIRLLIHHFVSASNALKAGCSELEDLPGFGPKIMEGWASWKASHFWKENLDLIQKHNIQLISYTDYQYPKRLLDIADHPVLLYVKGDIHSSDQQSIGIVGTRNPTIYGLEMADKIANDLASMGFTIVSGLARGIDTAAHRGALKGGRTFAVIGSGLANIYPHENSTLAHSISQKGCLVSEFPMNTPPDRQNFPQRNRIVSAMTMGTLLIEAPEKSGANDLFPSALIEKNSIPQFLLEKEEETFLSQLPKTEVSIEEITQTTKLPIRKINVLLMSLVLKRVIKEFPGKIYRKIL
jgi:DNA processing protein